MIQANCKLGIIKYVLIILISRESNRCKRWKETFSIGKMKHQSESCNYSTPFVVICFLLYL